MSIGWIDVHKITFNSTNVKALELNLLIVSNLIQIEKKWRSWGMKNFRRFSIWHIDVDLVTCKWWCTIKTLLRLIWKSKNTIVLATMISSMCLFYTCSMKKMKRSWCVSWKIALWKEGYGSIQIYVFEKGKFC